jgi:serine/threonine protein kinase
MQQAETETTQPTQCESERSVAEWLDALAAGKCDRGVLLRGVADSLADSPDEGWELLGLVDQYYRRHRISLEDFNGLNAQLQALLIGGPRSDDAGPASAVPKPPVQKRRPSVAESRKVADLAPPPPRAPTRAAGLGPIPGAAPTSAPRPAPTAAVPQGTVTAGELLRDRYRIQGILGRGGMGTVYAAIDQYRLDGEEGGQRVALKILHTEIVKRPHLLQELRSEFQRLQALSHPNIVRVHDFDRDGDLTFFTMEHLSGAPLSRVLAERNGTPLYRPHALAIIRQVGAAVAYAHSHGTVHGDLNPGNIFITNDGEIRVLDFGASNRLRPEPAIPELDDPSRVAVVTPSYASCELLVGRPPEARDDVYALACISYVLLTGKHPFEGRTALAARAQRLSPRRPARLSDRQWRALKAGLQSDRNQRPSDMQAWLRQLNVPSKPAALPPLHSVKSAPPLRGDPVRWVTGGLIALVAGLCWWALHNIDSVKSASAGVGSGASAVWSRVRGDSGSTSAANVAGQPAENDSQPRPTAAVPQRPAKVASHAVVARALPAVAAATGEAAPSADSSLARIELAADVVDVPPDQTEATVQVQRRHNYHGGVSFTWWTESGTATPGQDFVPVTPRTEYIPAGENQARLVIALVGDARRQMTRSFYVVIGDPSDGATLGARTLTMVTIPPSD